MKKFSILFLLLPVISAVNSFSQYNMSELKTIHSLDVSGDIQVELRFQDEPSLEIKSPDLSEECFIHGIEEGVLTLKIKPNINCNGQARAILAIPGLDAIKLTGKAEISSDKILKTDSLTIYQQLGSKAYLDVDVDALNVKLMEGSVLEIKGYADSQYVSVTSKASYNASGLQTDDAEISATLFSTAKVCVSDRLKASAGSSAYILYSCKPEQTDFSTNLGGKIEESSE